MRKKRKEGVRDVRSEEWKVRVRISRSPTVFLVL